MKEMYALWVFTLLALIVSFSANKEKTVRALRIALRRLKGIAPRFLIMLILVSIILLLVSDEMIARYLGNENKFLALILASLIGSVTFMPGFIAFPLAGILLGQGVLYMVVAGFTTTLMMVGVLTFPIEKAYMGTRVTIIRNSLSFLVAIAVALAVGIFFGELI
jgi:uncharacterized membrane protein YraQ (UPF0718 family)